MTHANCRGLCPKDRLEQAGASEGTYRAKLAALVALCREAQSLHLASEGKEKALEGGKAEEG